MSKPKLYKGGLLDTLMDTGQQFGGADSYSWHRSESTDNSHIVNGVRYANARSHLLTKKRLPWEAEADTGENKRAAWIEEVKGVMQDTGMNWRDSLKEASKRRKQNNAEYKTVVERVKGSYIGRTAQNVNCSPGKKCPGRYTKPVVLTSQGDVTYRPNAHNVSRAHLSTNAAASILRDYYKERSGSYKNGLRGATKAMRQDISKRKLKGNKTQSPCPTKMITVTRKDGKTYQRKIVDKSHPEYHECRSNWLYRATPGRFDMHKIDFGEGEDSPAYGIHTLAKPRKDKQPGKTSKRLSVR